MSDIKSLVLPSPPTEDEVRQGIELLFFAYRDFTAEPDAILTKYDFGRAHHRVIHFVGRHPQTTVGELLGVAFAGFDDENGHHPDFFLVVFCCFAGDSLT